MSAFGSAAAAAAGMAGKKTRTAKPAVGKPKPGVKPPAKPMARPKVGKQRPY